MVNLSYIRKKLKSLQRHMMVIEADRVIKEKIILFQKLFVKFTHL